MSNNIILEKYIEKLLNNQNNTTISSLKNIYSKKEYFLLLQDVLHLIKNNPNDNLETLQLKLFENSNISFLIKQLVDETKATPGLIISYGTNNFQETIIYGNKQEVIYTNNDFVYTPIKMTEDTIFDLASTSKIFTCIAILKLHELKILDLNSPITKYVPEFINLNDVTINDLLKFKATVETSERIDTSQNENEAIRRLLNIKHIKKELMNAYTDMGAMVLRIVIEKVSHMTLETFLQQNVFKPLNMQDTTLNVPNFKLKRVANQNYSSIILEDGSLNTNLKTPPGVAHDPKAKIMGVEKGIAPGHAGFFSSSKDMIKFANGLINNTILSKKTIFSMSESETAKILIDNVAPYFYGSLVYLKQPDTTRLSVPYFLSGKAFMSPGFAGTSLLIDPLNKIIIFFGANRLHNRIYQIHPSQQNNIITDPKTNKKIYIDSLGNEHIVNPRFTNEKEPIIHEALTLCLKYQLLEEIYNQQIKTSLVRIIK